MTSAADLNPMKPAARPEPAAPKQTSTKEDGVSFADVLETETAEPDSSDELLAATTDTNPAAAQPAPAQPQAIPAVNSPEAILAGLVQPVAPDAAAGVTAETPDATAAIPAPAPQPALPASAQAAASNPPSAGAQAAAAAAAQPAASNTDADAEEAGEGVEGATAAPSADKQAAATATTVVPAVTAPVAAPATTQSAVAEPLSAPAAERAAAPVETASPDATKTQSAGATTTDAGAKAQSGDNKAIQAAAASADAAPDIKAEAPTTPVASTADASATARAPTSDVARATQTHPALQNAPATTLQVYQRMVERFDGRAQRYEVRLDPAELGRVDVRIEVGADKKVHAVLAAHDSAALSDLMRGQRSLERALSDAGFDLADGGIQFELSSDRGQNSANQNSEGGNANVWRGFKAMEVAVDAQTAAVARPWRSSRLDLVA